MQKIFRRRFAYSEWQYLALLAPLAVLVISLSPLATAQDQGVTLLTLTDAGDGSAYSSAHAYEILHSDEAEDFNHYLDMADNETA